MAQADTKTEFLTVRVPAGLAEALRRRAVLENRSVSFLVRAALWEAVGVSVRDPRVRPGGDASRFERGR